MRGLCYSRDCYRTGWAHEAERGAGRGRARRLGGGAEGVHEEVDEAFGLGALADLGGD
jgi:hypothetical protein